MENFWGNQFISSDESVPQEENILFGASLLEYDLLCLCVYAFAVRRHCTQSSYLISSSSSSSSSSSASIAAEIATRCLPWAQRRQLLIYRDRTTEPLTPASTRSIPITIVILSASHNSFCLSPALPRCIWMRNPQASKWSLPLFAFLSFVCGSNDLRRLMSRHTSREKCALYLRSMRKNCAMVIENDIIKEI